MRILFITSTRIGDGVLSSGILNHLLEANPGARVSIVCGPAGKELFEGVPGLEEIIVLDKKPFSLHWLEMWVKSIGKIWDVVVDLRNAPLSAILFAKRQYHLGRATKNNLHRVVALASVLGLEQSPPRPRLWVRGSDKQNAATLIPVPDEKPIIAIGPSANWKGKVWASDRFAELGERMVADNGIIPGATIAVFAHESERKMAAPVIDALKAQGKEVIDLVGTHHLLSVYACLQRCSFYVGNDSGLMHMAAAAGIPTLGLFGPSRQEHYAPWGEKCAYVRTDLDYDAIFTPQYNHLTTESLMDTLSVKKVEQAVNKLWLSVQ